MILGIKLNSKTINADDIYTLLIQLSTLVSAGIPLHQSCDILEKSQSKFAFRFFLYSIKKNIFSGKPLSTSLKEYPQFDAIICHLIHIGEATGKMELMLKNAAEYQAQKVNFKNKLKQILFYPCLLLAFALFIILGILVFIIPKFSELFSNSNIELPWITKFLFASATLLNKNVGYISIITVIIFTLMLVLKKKLGIYAQKFFLYLRLPIIFSLYHKIFLLRINRNLSIMLNAGIPITECLTLCSTQPMLTKQKYLFVKLHKQVCAGLSLNQALQSLNFFPIVMQQMIKIGEETGMLNTMLDKAGDLLEVEITNTLNYFNKLLEPLIILVLGVLIGGIVIGLYLPIFKLGSVL